MEENFDLKIEAYLGGDMTPEEQKQFEEMMSQNPKLREEVQLANEVNHHLNDSAWMVIEADKNDPVKQELENYVKSDEAIVLKSKLRQVGANYKKKRSNSSSIKYIVGAVAAILIIALISNVFWNSRPSHDVLYTEFYIESDLPSIIKRGSENKLLTEAVALFKSNEYDQAIQLFEQYERETQGTDPSIYIYTGFSYLENGNFDRALQNFDKLLNSDSIDKSKAFWYKSLVYLKSDRIEECKTILSQIIDDSLFNAQKAKRLLGELE
ncbi:tetratricopeptide repeat protein [Aquimarina spongiae]|uniref:Uncharacterized protein n=1 Tax=Aquimarina spongiae TaxID=570521 RepID=A0A1M6EG72_9FLAO|nr:tetratricopeptide repeat protein [Aquimarina spongiae]SHI84423.1 hypothetical protein SAMN04488508_103392 [Aquimarina spongiae]